MCYWGGFVVREDEVLSLELARESSEKGSRYGQHVLGLFYQFGRGGIAPDDCQILTLYRLAAALYRLAAAQNLDSAQLRLGHIYDNAHRGVSRDRAEALRFYKLAAAQGYPVALFVVADFHEHGRGIPKNKAEAIRLYQRAQAADNSMAVNALKRLCA